MTLDEAINHAEEVAEEQVKLCKRYDDASGYSRSHNETIRVADAKKCEKCADEHEQLAEWLRDYRRLLDQQPCEDCVSRQAVKDRMIKYGFHAPDMTITEFVEDVLPPVTPAFNWIPVSKKLQKIEQIIKEHDEDRMPEDYFYIDKIREVIKNDN